MSSAQDSRSSIERVGHAVAAEYLSRREQVEPELIETCELPPGIVSVSVSVDRVTVPMEEPVPSAEDSQSASIRCLISESAALLL